MFLCVADSCRLMFSSLHICRSAAVSSLDQTTLRPVEADMLICFFDCPNVVYGAYRAKIRQKRAKQTGSVLFSQCRGEVNHSASPKQTVLRTPEYGSLQRVLSPV